MRCIYDVFYIKYVLLFRYRYVSKRIRLYFVFWSNTKTFLSNYLQYDCKDSTNMNIFESLYNLIPNLSSHLKTIISTKN